MIATVLTHTTAAAVTLRCLLQLATICHIYPLQKVLAAGRLGFLLTYDAQKAGTAHKQHHAILIDRSDDVHAFHQLLVSYHAGNTTAIHCRGVTTSAPVAHSLPFRVPRCVVDCRTERERGWSRKKGYTAG